MYCMVCVDAEGFMGLSERSASVIFAALPHFWSTSTSHNSSPAHDETMTNANWKRRAESMLSQFIEGSAIDDGDVDIYYDAPTSSPPKLKPYFRLENFSTSDQQPTCGADSVYDRLLGCSCHRGDYAVGDGTCGSLFLQWVKLAFGGVVKAYLSNPLFLALLPLALGAIIGYYLGNRNGANRKHSTVFGRISEIFHWACLHLMLRQSKTSELLFDEERDERTRSELKAIGTKRESGVELECVPRHVAVIMDGNRRYGKEKYGSATRGHWDGSKTLIEFGKWCMHEGVQILTVYAFSTENWNRDAEEVSTLMSIFCKYCDELRIEAIERGMRIHVLTTDGERIPEDVRKGIERMEEETKHCTNFTMNVCLSYGGRNEIANACKSIAMDVQAGKMNVNEIGEAALQNKMLTNHCCDPDIIIRTSGEERISNFLLWQAAYSEFFFLKKQWPELEKADLLDVIRTFAHGRKRRYGK
jgi:undecaprenyl diphosphate synthase